MTDTAGVWLHAVTRDLPAPGIAGLAGVGGGPVRAVQAAGLVAIVSSVDLDEFGAEPMRHNLEDLAWLESVARAHHGVIEAAGRLGCAVPARLGTVYGDDARVRTVLRERRDDFTTVLDRVAGHDEWGVKAYATDPAAASVSSPSSSASSSSSLSAAGRGGAGPGAAYLRRRRAELGAAQRQWQAALDGAEQVHATLTGHAGQASRHPPQDRNLSGQPDPMVLNGAYLVGTARADRFTAAVAALATRFPGLRLQLTGPWPPYSFVAVAVSVSVSEESPP